MPGPRISLISALFLVIVFTASDPLHAEDNVTQLESRIDLLETTIDELIEELAELRNEATNTAATVERQHAAVVEQHEVIEQTETTIMASAVEWQNATSSFHISGYGAARYANQEGTNGEFDSISFNPIFHFLYRDKILWESELELEIEENGETEVNLEYSTIDWFINDTVTLIAGKFISPLGQFRQNLHPAWINKLPTAPPGFGHDGAAPEADIGLQFRGGAPFGDRSMFTYAVYVANGPELEGEDGEVHEILTEGYTRNVDDLAFGGRVSILPTGNLEIGLSAAVGEASVTVNDEEDIDGDPARDYESYGADFFYRWRQLETRGEYIAQDIDDETASVASAGGKWDSWYLQSSYRFSSAIDFLKPWELVARYTDFSSPQPSQEQKQWAFGINYLISPNALIKFSYELNDGLLDTETDADRWLAQFAYGY